MHHHQQILISTGEPDRVEEQRAKSLGIRPSVPPKTNKNKLRVNFLAEYCDLIGVASFDDLSPAIQASAVEAWTTAKRQAGVP